MHPDIPLELERVFPGEIDRVVPVRGGNVCAAWKVSLTSGRVLFAKTLDTAPAGFFDAEATGLEWLADAGALSVPEVLSVTGPASAGGHLVLPYLVAGPPPDHAANERLGRSLAALHQVAAPGWGFPTDNFIGPLPQPNGQATAPSWPAFFRDHRLVPQLHLAEQKERLTPRIRHTLVRVLPRIDELLATTEGPVRVHGDLWNGNVLFDETGEPWLLDPAAYGGHREVDLAMMALFGGFDRRVFLSYAEALPLEPGWERRQAAYQLYPLLVHLNLFGSQYNKPIEAVLERLR